MLQGIHIAKLAFSAHGGGEPVYPYVADRGVDVGPAYGADYGFGGQPFFLELPGVEVYLYLLLRAPDEVYARGPFYFFEKGNDFVLGILRQVGETAVLRREGDVHDRERGGRLAVDLRFRRLRG